MHNKIVVILATRGKTADFMRDVILRDDGFGPYIDRWDEAKLGPRPTQEELDAVDVAKIEHNAGIDKQVLVVEEINPFKHRGLREGLYALPAVADLLNIMAAQIEAEIRTIPGHETFTLQRLPDLKKNGGMKRIKAADDAIRALLAQRLP